MKKEGASQTNAQGWNENYLMLLEWLLQIALEDEPVSA